MKKLLILAGLIGATVLLTNCSHKIPATLTTTEKTPQGEIAEVKKHYTDQQMTQGMAIYQSSCKKCHRLHAPEERTVAQWDNILPSMSRKAKLTDEQAGMVRAYILAHGAKMS